MQQFLGCCIRLDDLYSMEPSQDDKKRIAELEAQVLELLAFKAYVEAGLRKLEQGGFRPSPAPAIKKEQKDALWVSLSKNEQEKFEALLNTLDGGRHERADLMEFCCTIPVDGKTHHRTLPGNRKRASFDFEFTRYPEDHPGKRLSL